jgi:hypothetical protein
MKKIFISFFVFGLFLFSGALVYAQKADVSAQAEPDTSMQAMVDISPNVVKDDTATQAETVVSDISGETKIDTSKPITIKPNPKPNPIPTSATDWTNVGAPGFSAGMAIGESIAISPNNIPYLAYVDDTQNRKATVVKFDGGSWVDVGTPGFTVGEAETPSLAIDSNGAPYIAYVDYSNSQKITVMKFDGTNWIPVGVPGFSANSSWDSQLIIDSNNTLYVSYVDNPNSTILTVDKFNGTDWVPVGTPIISSNGMGTSSGFGQSSFKVDSNGILYIAYTENLSVNNSQIDVKKFDGANWVPIGIVPGFSSQFQLTPSLAISSSNVPYLAYELLYLSPTEWKAATVKFNGSNWDPVGLPISQVGTNDDLGISLALNSVNVPYLVFSDVANNNKTTVKMFDNTSWINVGTPGFSDGYIEYLSLIVDRADNLYVTYSDTFHSNRATVMKYGDNVLAQALTITSPNGGETFTTGDIFTATWTSTGLQPTDDLYFGLMQDDSGIYYSLTGSTLNDGTEVFTIPTDIKPGQYKLYGRKPNTSIEDYSDNSFTINPLPTGDCMPAMAPWIKVLSPNGGEVFHPGDQMTVKWSSCNIPASTLLSVEIISSSSSGSIAFGFWTPSGTPNDGTETFTIDMVAPDSSSYKIIVGIPVDGNFLNSNLSPVDDSDFTFTITSGAPSLTILSPNGGETFTHGQQFTATWTSTGLSGIDQMYFGLIQNGTNLYYVLTGQTTNDGSEVFTVPSNIQPGQYKMYGRFISTPVDDFSDNSFTVN